MEMLQHSLKLVLQHRWLFQCPATEILVKNLLDAFPEGWTEALESLTTDELNDVVVGKFSKEAWPLSLLEFLESCTNIKEEFSKTVFSINSEVKYQLSAIPKQLTVGLSAKKQHEALLLAQLTHEMCIKERLRVIVDLGAGLGYVCQMLHHLFNYKLLGLESSSSITETANRRRDNLYPSSVSSVHYSCVEISENSSLEIQKVLETFTGMEKTNFCLIGLHACGDLSSSALRLFRQMENAKVLIMMSCCYHKLECCEDNKSFRNFPMSQGLKIQIEERSNLMMEDLVKILHRPFMRLACQEPSDRWENMSEEDHHVHSMCLMARGILDLYCHRNKIKLTKMKRKSARTSHCKNFDEYLQNFVLRYNFNGRPLDERCYEEISALWEENKWKLRRCEIYTGLQLLLQAPAEYLVLNDRKQWLVEQGFPDTTILSVLDRKLSPRSHAIVSTKRSQ